MKVTSYLQKLRRLSSRLTLSKRLKPAVFVLAFAAIGSIWLIAIRATTPFASTEPEQGAKTGIASLVNDTMASGNAAVQFGGAETGSDLAGVFITRAELDRAKARGSGTTEPFRGSYNAQKSRADSALSATPDPFYMEQNDYMQNIEYGWCSDDNDGKDDALGEATKKLEKDGNLARTLALQYALTGDQRYGDKAAEFLLAWSNRSTPVNMYDFFVDPITFNGGLRDGTSEFCSFRPYNFALDGLFQGYGLINFADAYVLLTRNGYSFTVSDNTAVQAYIRRLTEAVNSSFHAWTRWADNHPNSSSYTRYRGDNHLSWGLAPLLAASVALQDNALAAYCLDGGTWTDSKAGAYKNPSHIRDVIDRAVLSDGRIIDPVQFGRPETYTYFHLWPMQLVARMAELHYAQDIWSFKGTDGKGLEAAYDTAVDKVISGEFSNQSWQYELAYNKWPTARNLSARNETNRQAYIVQSYGPVVLLFGQ